LRQPRNRCLTARAAKGKALWDRRAEAYSNVEKYNPASATETPAGPFEYEPFVSLVKEL